MSLQQWLDNSWIQKIAPSRQTVMDLLAIAQREITDASLPDLSPEGRFTHAYDAVRCLCEVALHASGYVVPKGGNKHQRVIESLKCTLGDEWTEEVDFLDRCRRRRHQSIYERGGLVQERDANELLGMATRLNSGCRDWLEREHPDLI